MTKRTLRVLHVEDSERDAALLTRHLSRAGYDLTSERVETAAGMKTALEAREWDVVFCDYSMPHFDALSALALLKETGLDIPFIIISGTIGEEIAVEAMRAGAHDYLMKDNLARLAPTVERELQEAEHRRARRQAERALKESEDRYRDLVEHSQELICTHDLTGRMLSVNPWAAKVLGYDRDDLLKKNMRDYLAPEFRDRFDEYLAAIRREGFAQGLLVVQTAAGERRIWEYNNSLRTEGVEVPIVRGIAHDITERRRGEEALRESEARYRLLFESNPHPMWAYDIETLRFLAVNDAAVRHYGYSREEFLRMTIKDIRPPEDIPSLLENVARVGEGLDEAGVWKHRKKDGSVIDVDVTSHSLTFAGKRAEVVLACDITERKRAEVALRKAEEKYRGIFENAVEGIFQSTSDGRFIAVNPALVRILGFDSEQDLIAHRNDIGTQHYVDPDVRAELARTLEERGGVVGFECEVFRKDGEKICVVENIRAVSGEDGAMLYYEGSIEDITERKTLEAQLRQSQRLEAVGLLAGGIAHDFNNLLTAIIGYSELTLLKLREEDPLHRKVSEIKKAAARAAGLTGQLLAFSRKQVLQPKILDLNALVSELEKMLRRLIGEDVELRVALAHELGNVKADPGQLEQVVMNLAVNARDAMPQGGKLTIETQNVHLDDSYARQHIAVRPGPYVMLAVSDTGAGMDAETQARVFEPFFTTKEVGKGTGLGLSTVYGIVKQSGGNIWVYSEVGRGTTFKIYLPLIGEGAQAYTRGSEVEEAARGTETVLLAEDEEVVRTLAREVLESYGYRVLEAANGGAALLICERRGGPIHLLLTDVVMPEMSGRELSNRLARLRPEMKVLYMSGYTDNAIVHQGVLDEGENFIQKPFAPSVLARKVREVLDEERRLL